MTLSLKNYVRASANMMTTKKKILINLKNQFETIYGKDYQVRNTAAYVEKYLLKLRFMGISYGSWEKAPFLAAGLVTLLAGAEAFYGYLKSAKTTEMVEILFAYVTVLVCFFVFFHIFGIKNKRAQIQIQLVDYLENYLANRLLKSKEAVRTIDAGTEEKLMEQEACDAKTEEGNMLRQQEKVRQERAAADTGTEDMEEDMEMLQRLIKEFEHNRQKKDVETGVSGSEQMAVAEEPLCEQEESPHPKTKEEAELELLEEFVQSFLA